MNTPGISLEVSRCRWLTTSTVVKSKLTTTFKPILTNNCHYLLYNMGELCLGVIFHLEMNPKPMPGYVHAQNRNNFISNCYCTMHYL